MSDTKNTDAAPVAVVKTDVPVAAPAPVLLTSHKVNGANNDLSIEVDDQPGAGGANHRYTVRGFDTSGNPSRGKTAAASTATILFQNGPIGDAGVNGLTHEVLLAVLIHRLEAFQNGPYANPYNARALNALVEAQVALKQRTEERIGRGVEGTHVK